MHTRSASFAHYLFNILNFLATLLLDQKKSLKCRGSLTFVFVLFCFLPIIVHSTKHFVQLWARYFQNSSYTIQLGAVSAVFPNSPPECLLRAVFRGADGPPGFWVSAVLRKPTPTLRPQDHPPPPLHPLVTHVIVMLWYLAEINAFGYDSGDREEELKQVRQVWHFMARRVGIKQQEMH